MLRHLVFLLPFLGYKLLLHLAFKVFRALVPLNEGPLLYPTPMVSDKVGGPIFLF